MKITKVFLCLIFSFLILLSTKIYAVETQLKFIGDGSVKPGETKTVVLQLSSDIEAIGVISGVLKGNDNISEIQMEGQNGWQVTYNKTTGEFNALKAEGAKNEGIAIITYTVKSDATGNVSITIGDNITLTTIEYKTIEITNITKNITINSETEKNLTSIELTKKPNKVRYTEGEKFDKTGMAITAKYNDGTSKEITEYVYTPSSSLKTSDKKITISYKEGNITKTVECDITVTKVNNNTQESTKNPLKQEGTTSPTVIPQTGYTNYAIIFIFITLIICIVSYIRYKKYNKI